MDILVTYSLLSTIKEKHENVDNLICIYKELTEGLLAELNFQSKGKGLLTDLRFEFDEKFKIVIPFPTLKIILTQISHERTDFQLFSDFSFIHDPASFNDLNEYIETESTIIEEIKSVYMEICKSEGIVSPMGFDFFINLNRRELISYLNGQKVETVYDREFLVFKNLYKIAKYKTSIDKLVMGSILSTYIELDLVGKIKRKTFLLDTNFIVSLLNLHSVESKITCDEIIKIALKSTFRVEVLPETIKETRNLLNRKSNTIESTNIFTSTDLHTIESGCARRKLSGGDLWLISSKIEQILIRKGVTKVSDGVNSKLFRTVRSTNIYEKLKDRPFNKEGIIHDAMAMNYVKENRDDGENGFAQTSSFFVTDTQGKIDNKITDKTHLPYLITTEELLNILWLLNPTNNSLITSTNISTIFSRYLKKRLPDKNMLKAMDDKIQALDEVPIEIKDCAELAVNISVKDTKSIQDFLTASGTDEIKRKLQILADRARQSKEEEVANTFNQANNIVSIVQRKLKEQQEKVVRRDSAIKHIKMQITDKDTEIKRVKKEFSDELEYFEIDKYTSQLKLRKSFLEIELLRDEDELNFINEQIELWEKRHKRHVNLISVSFLGFVLFAFLVISKNIIVPNWNRTEPYTYIISICIPLILLIIHKINPNRKVFKPIDRIVALIKKKSIRNHLRSVKRKEDIQNRIIERANELKDIIL